jgi:hypothetical protein
MSTTSALSKARRVVAGILVGAAGVTGAITAGFVAANVSQSATADDSGSTSASGGFTQTSTVTSSGGSSQTSTHGS